ncbi:MAG TPA: hypothetical protein VL916_08645 [Ilumatobacteraceae bacterium]|nr:hypothetical protein [Ilumatobacteraceae bacterium]
MGDVGGSIDEGAHAVRWFAVIVFAYYYKALLVGFMGGVLGIEWLGGTMIRGISTNHWIEIVIYCPLLWLALHQVNENVFGGDRGRRHLIGAFAIALVIYGTGVHIANVIEIYSREQRGIEEGDVYSLVYFLDEGFSHYLQFVPLFFVIGWFVINDRPRVGVYSTVALFLGAGHGVERAIGIIEGGKWFLGAPTVVWIGAAAWIRGHRLQRLHVDPRDDFFFRYAISFCVTLPVAQLTYLGRFGSFAQPSELAESGARLTGIGVIVLTAVGTSALVASERWWNPRRRHPVPAGLAA